MTTKTSFCARVTAVAVLSVAALGTTSVAQAGGNVSWSVGVGLPGVSVAVGNGYGAYVQPAPIYVQPAPVYAPPVTYRPPRYVQAAPMYVPPRPVIYAPPVYVAPRPIYHRPVAPGYDGNVGYGNGGYRYDNRNGNGHRR